jgi:hypothetical protein
MQTLRPISRSDAIEYPNIVIYTTVCGGTTAMYIGINIIYSNIFMISYGSEGNVHVAISQRSPWRFLQIAVADSQRDTTMLRNYRRNLARTI